MKRRKNSSNKRSKESIDRLSALPDSLLIHILTFVSLNSYVNVMSAARTSVLSKRWRYLWCDLTRLQFIYNGEVGDIDETNKFVAMVYRTLLCRTAKSLEEFHLFLFYGQPWAYHLDIWVEFALKLKSKIVRLSLPPEDDLTDEPPRYSPPELLYSNSVLMELRMEFCTLAPRDWKSLTKLLLECVELHQHVVENILSESPVMCCLELCACWGFNSLKIDSPLLHKLIVTEVDDVGMVEMLEISAPYLSILEIMFYLDGRQVRLKNIPTVVEVTVDIGDTHRYYFEELPADVIDVVKDLFDDIQHIKKLHMKSDFFLFVSKMMADGQQLQQQSRWLSLTIDNIFEGHINSGVLNVLGYCPNLETLELHKITKEPPPSSPVSMSDDPSPPLSMSDDLNCDLLHLKMVRMKISVRVSVKSFPMLMLVRILLTRAVALEKMEIKFEILNRAVKMKDRMRFDKVVAEVLSWPKSSQALLVTSLISPTNSRK